MTRPTRLPHARGAPPSPSPAPAPAPPSGPARARANPLRRGLHLPARRGAARQYERFCADPRDAAVAAWLRRGGVRRLVVGHKPSGDSPAVLCSRYTGLEVISADLSYSDACAPDNRGAAVAGVLIRGESLQANHALVYGTLSDGRRHEARLRTLGGDEDGAGGDPYVGSEVGEGWWVKARCWAPSGAPSGATYLLAKGAGRKVEYRNVPVDEMERHVQIDLVEELPTGGESCASS